MKSYEVNYVAKVATITKKTTPAEKRMLERMGLKLEMKKEKARPSYNQIEIFISYLENGLERGYDGLYQQHGERCCGPLWTRHHDS